MYAIIKNIKLYVFCGYFTNDRHAYCVYSGVGTADSDRWSGAGRVRLKAAHGLGKGRPRARRLDSGGLVVVTAVVVTVVAAAVLDARSAVVVVVVVVARGPGNDRHADGRFQLLLPVRSPDGSLAVVHGHCTTAVGVPTIRVIRLYRKYS